MKFVDLDSFDLIEILRPYCSFGGCCDIEYEIRKKIVDATPVVRCKDCKYKKPLGRCFDRKGNQLYYCDNDYGLSAHLKEDFFCCFGTRKDSVNEDNI